MPHREEPVADHGVDVDLAALRNTVAGFVFKQCCGGTGSFDVGEVLVCGEEKCFIFFLFLIFFLF